MNLQFVAFIFLECMLNNFVLAIVKLLLNCLCSACFSFK
ncbi:unnamed protein product [Musa acuminata subsp. malaccensis]|uniref:(wild Malaysian banana) hypothetical protein n=1 Tax=Musa acuminata subsp. malaccensis TaxID=214687 RepID=A0A804KRT5_MUSAM|nr:unnamed protein product [Musa acuminata subsp. malaccensis]